MMMMKGFGVLKECNKYSVVLGIVVVAITLRGVVGAPQPSAECLIGCKPICMNLKGAIDSICDLACSFGCVQLKGKAKAAKVQLKKDPS